jgi:hypothetical protein
LATKHSRIHNGEKDSFHLQRRAHSSQGSAENERSVKTAAKHHKSTGRKLAERDWSKNEDDRLRVLYKRGTELKLIASAMGRTPASCSTRASRLGLKPRPHWTEEEQLKLRNGWGKLERHKIAKMVGKTKKACYHKARSLGLLTSTNSLTEVEESEWSKEDDYNLWGFWIGGLDVKDIAFEMDKTVQECADRLICLEEKYRKQNPSPNQI